jgi:uncharacterized coiled-coil protein SlyX
MNSSVEIKDMIAGVEHYIERAASLLAAGQYADLGELEPRVNSLCQNLQHMRADQAQHFLDQLESLYEKVDALKESMLAHQTDVRQELNGLATQKRASHAYVKSGALSDNS